MKLSVIVLNWNAADDTIRCIRSVLSWCNLQPIVWVVDNASKDQGVELIAQHCPGARLLHSATNRGFAGGNNLAIRCALDEGGERILLLNNDASIDEENVARLVASLAANPELGVVGPLLRDEGEGSVRLSAGGRDISRHITSRIYYEEYPTATLLEAEPLRRVDYVPGAVALIRAELFRTVGLFDEDYFFGGELADFCERARQHGYESAINVQAIATHRLDRSSKLRDTLHIYYVVRNRFLFINKFRSAQKIPLCGFWAGYGLYLFFLALMQGRRRRARAIRLALLDGLSGRCGNQNERVLS
jgi:GT2 family glycosyltransferase